MNFFSKLYFSMLILLTLALSITEYYVVALSLDSSLDTQVETALRQHQLVKYAIQSDMLSAYQTQGGNISKATMQDIAQLTSGSMNVTLELYSADDNDIIVTTIKEEVPQFEMVDSSIQYCCGRHGDKTTIYSFSRLNLGENSYNIVTASDISFVYENAEHMLLGCLWVYIAVIAVGSLFAFGFSLLITRPIKALTRVGAAFTQGDYSGRVYVSSKDEIGELADVYNEMADTIEEKIGDLELAVKQREDFTAAFAHELKTPMTSIIGYADTLYQKDLTEMEARTAAGFIVNEGMRLEALSFKLLELMTLNKSDYMLEEIQMADFLRDIEDTILPAAAKKGVRTFFDYEPGYARIEYDLFKTLILNLIDNAMKSGTPDVAVLAQARGDIYMIAVVDHGRGIPASELRRVTEAFYMVDKARSRKEHGAGLGLALCQKIAEIHGTRLDIRSQEGEGTAIRIRLKLVEGDKDEEDQYD